MPTKQQQEFPPHHGTPARAQAALSPHSCVPRECPGCAQAAPSSSSLMPAEMQAWLNPCEVNAEEPKDVNGTRLNTKYERREEKENSHFHLKHSEANFSTFYFKKCLNMHGRLLFLFKKGISEW